MALLALVLMLLIDGLLLTDDGAELDNGDDNDEDDDGQFVTNTFCPSPDALVLDDEDDDDDDLPRAIDSSYSFAASPMRWSYLSG